MARTRTLAELRADVRFQADVEREALRHPNTKLTRLINQSIQAFRLMISKSGQPYYLATSASANTVLGTDAYALPTDLVRLFGVDLTHDERTISLSPYMFAERNDYTQEASNSDRGWPVYYRIHTGNNIRLTPIPDGVYAYVFQYLQYGTDLVDDTDTFDGLGGWEDWVVYDSALRVLARDVDSEQYQLVRDLRDKRELEIKGDAPRRARAPGRRVDTMRRRGDAASGAHRWWRR